MFLNDPKKDEGLLRIIVRLKTNVFWRGNNDSFCVEKSIRLMKRKSNGRLEDIICDLADDVLSLDFNNLDDGLYELQTCNRYYYWETGELIDYELELIPYLGV